jgi:signal transduction histidine kinase
MKPSTDLAALTRELHLLSMQQADDAVPQRLLECIVRGVGAQSGSLAVVAPDGGSDLAIVAGVDLPASALGARVVPGHGVLGQVALTQVPVLIEGERDGEGRQQPRGSSICWPLQVQQRLIGVLSINRPASDPPLTRDDLERGDTFVAVLALLVDNTLMRREQLRRIDALSQLNVELQQVNHRLGQTQAQLLQSEKMASIGQLAAGVAHEINNPIGYVTANVNALQGYLDDLLRAARGQARADGQPVDLDYLAEDLPALLAETREGLERVAKIVRDLKDFSRVDTGDDWEWADLVAGLRSTLNIVSNELKYKAEVLQQLQTLPPVQCRPSQLNQVFMNLLVNAAQAMEDRGTIQLRCGHEGEWVWFEFVDNGCGMDEAVSARIFEPFFTTKPVGKGTGLGLSVSYSIVQKHHGRISVISQRGHGTTFRIELPVAQPLEGSTSVGQAHA